MIPIINFKFGKNLKNEMKMMDIKGWIMKIIVNEVG